MARRQFINRIVDELSAVRSKSGTIKGWKLGDVFMCEGECTFVQFYFNDERSPEMQQVLDIVRDSKAVITERDNGFLEVTLTE